MSHGSHVWGPDSSHNALILTNALAAAADKVHMSFVQFMADVSKHTCVDVIVRDLQL